MTVFMTDSSVEVCRVLGISRNHLDGAAPGISISGVHAAGRINDDLTDNHCSGPLLTMAYPDDSNLRGCAVVSAAIQLFCWRPIKRIMVPN